MTMMSVVALIVISSIYFVEHLRQFRILPLTVLLPEDLLDLTDFFLHFSGYFFGFAFGFQFGIVGNFPGHFPGLTLCFVKGALHVVLHARFHGIPPFRISI